MVLSLLHKQMNLFHYSCAQSPSVLCLLFSHRALSTIQLRALLISVPALHIAHKCKLVLSLPTCCLCWAWCCWQSRSGKVKSVDHVHLYFNPFHVRDSKLHEPTGLERTRLKMPAVDLQTEWKHRLCMQFWWECTGPALENKRLCVRVCARVYDDDDECKQKERGRERRRARSVLINHDWLIQSPLVFSPSLPRSSSPLWLDYGDVLYLSLPPLLRLSLLFFIFSLFLWQPPHHQYYSPPPLQRLPNCATLFIPPRKGGCQSPRLPCLHPLTRRRTSPPSIHPRPIHQSFFSLSPSFFPPCLTHSCHFVTLLYIKFPLFLRSKLSSIYLHPPFSSLYCIQWSVSACLSGTLGNGKKQTHKAKTHSLSLILSLSLCLSSFSRGLSWRSWVLTQPGLIQMLPEMHPGKASLGLLF